MKRAVWLALLALTEGRRATILPNAIPIPPDACSPPLTGPPDLTKNLVSAATFNIQTQEATPWAPRKCPARKVIATLGFPTFLSVQECDVDMLKDIVQYGPDQTYFTMNGEFRGEAPIFLPGFSPVTNYCRLKTGPCNVWGTYDNCNGPSIPANQGFMLLYRNSSDLRLVVGGRFQFTTQEGCPKSEVVRNYEFGVFQLGSKPIVVYASHLAWPQADDTNTAQSKDLYVHAMANFNGATDRPTYIGQSGNFQLDVAGMPFVIIGDLNSFQNQGKWDKTDLQMDVTSQWDWVLSKNLATKSTAKVSGAGATDHEYALGAVYNFAW